MLKDLILFSFLLAFILIIITYYIDHPSKVNEKKLSYSKTIELYIIRYIHWIPSICIVLYIFFVRYNITYDLIYLLISFLVVLHWYLIGNGECIFSYYEKNLLDKNYKKGDTKIDLFINIIKDNIFSNNKNNKNVNYIWIINIGYVIIRVIYYNFIYPKNLFFKKIIF